MLIKLINMGNIFMIKNRKSFKIKFINLFLTCFILVVILFFMLWLSQNAEAKTWYVDDSGGADFEKIQDANDACEDGDIIRVYEGIYYENVVLNKTVSLIGNGSVNTSIDGNGSGDVIIINIDYVILNGFKITNGSMGIIVESNYNQITNNNFINNDNNGIYISYSEYNNISNNVCNSNKKSGIYLFWSSSNSLINNDCLDNEYYDIYLWRSKNITLNNNIGIIYIKQSNNNNITASDGKIFLDYSGMNTLNSNIGDISLDHSNNNTLNYIDGRVSFKDSNHNTHTISKGKISLVNSNFNTLLNNNCSNNRDYGIYLELSNKNILMNNTCNSNYDDGCGIYLEYSDNNVLLNNTCSNNYYDYGIFLRYSNNNTLKNNTCKSNYFHGIYLDNCNQNTLENNTCLYNYYGIYLEKLCDNNTIMNNNCTINEATNLYIKKYCNNNTIINNIGSISLYLCNNSIIMKNSGSISLSSCINNNLSNNICNNNKNEGIYLGGCYNSQLINNICNNNHHGIRISGCEYTTLTNNKCNYNNWTGICLEFSGNITLLNNTCSNNEYGIQVILSNNNIFSNNTIFYNNFGIFVGVSSKNNTVVYNNIFNNYYSGINATYNDNQFINASNNWWGHNSGPYHISKNPTGNGNNVSDYVIFNPWLVTGINVPPRAYINSISPIPGIRGGNIHFVGNGIDDGKIIRFVWRSSINGEFYNGTNPEFNCLNLSIGWHIIYLKVMDNTSLWSLEVNTSFLIIPDSRPTITVDIQGRGDYIRIQDAIDAAEDGYTVFVNEGTYYENIIIDKSINLTGISCDKTIIIGENINDVVKITADWVNISGFKCIMSKYGLGAAILRIESNFNLIYENYFPYIIYNGILFYYSNWNIFKNNDCSNNQINLIYSNNNSIKNNLYIPLILSHSNNNIIYNNEGYISLSECDHNFISNNICNENYTYAISLERSKYNKIINNNCSNNIQGISLRWISDYNEISNNNFSNNENGIYLSGVDFNIFYNNTLIGNINGSLIHGSNSNIFKNNTFFRNLYGLCFEEKSYNNRIHYNNIFNNIVYGIDATKNGGSYINAIKNWWGDITGPNHYVNNTNGNGDNVSDFVEFYPWIAKYVEKFENLVYNINKDKYYFTIQEAIDKAIDGDTIKVFDGIYYENIILNKQITLIGNGSTNTIIDAFGKGDVVIISADWVNMSGFTVTGSGSHHDAGVHIISSYNTIFDNDCFNNYLGIRLVSSNYNFIYNNILNLNDDEGIYLSSSNYNILSNNNCSNNGCSGRMGSFNLVSSNSNTISNNTCSNNDYSGFYLSSSRNNIIQNNTFNNNNYGISIFDSYENILINNSMSMNNVGVYVWCGFIETFQYNSIYNNKEFGINVGNCFGVYVNAINNWWGHTTGPYHMSENPDGKGDNISNRVIFDPWLNEPVYILDNLPPITNAGIDQTFYIYEENQFIGIGIDIDGKIINYEWDLDGDGSYDWESTTTGITSYTYKILGIYNVTFRVTDNEGAIGLDTCTIKISTRIDSNYPPTISLVSPSNNSLINSTSTTLIWDCIFNETISFTYDIYLDTSLNNMKKVSSNLIEKSYNITDLIDGQIYYWKVVVTDGYIEVESEIWSFTVKLYSINEKPTVIIINPQKGEKIKGIYEIKGTASDDSLITIVEINIDNNGWYIITGTTNWSYSWDTTRFENGIHKIYVRAYDGKVYSDIVTVEVENEDKQPPQDAEDKSSDNDLFGFLLPIGCFVVILFIVLIILFKNRQPPKTDNKREIGLMKEIPKFEKTDTKNEQELENIKPIEKPIEEFGDKEINGEEKYNNENHLFMKREELEIKDIKSINDSIKDDVKHINEKGKDTEEKLREGIE